MQAIGTLASCDEDQFRIWEDRREHIGEVAKPLLESEAFKRLGAITFLGILSPRFAKRLKSPLCGRRDRNFRCDGSRRSHSLGVANIVLDICDKLRVSPTARKYAAAWALTHDIANWPLSHTGEAAFERLTGVTSRDLRAKFIIGSDELRRDWWLAEPLESMGVKPDRLIRLFDRATTSLGEELDDLLAVIRSPITPDTIEGIWRSGIAFGVDVPAPEDVGQSLTRDMFDILVDSEYSATVVTFWRRKAKVYDDFINRPATVYWESAWSLGIQREFRDIGLLESLELTEADVIERITARGLPTDVHFSRFRKPMSYYVASPRVRTLPANMQLQNLRTVLVKRREREFRMTSMDIQDIRPYVKARTYVILERANELSLSVLEKTREFLSKQLKKLRADEASFCFAAIGSVGRLEALDASDLDIIPIAADESALAIYQPHDDEIREALQVHLSMKVSRGLELTKATTLNHLIDSESIGGDRDGRGPLTQRILILSESTQAGGELSLEEVRKQILNAYAGAERTSGRHLLSFCNDLARYYRTLCIEYKAKVDNEAKDWCTRNMKLRHARKFWYFSSLLSIARLSAQNPTGDKTFVSQLLQALAKPPYLRLNEATTDLAHNAAGRVLDRYAWFLEFMSTAQRREALAAVDHNKRYDVSLDNPFPQVKLNSDAMHNEMLNILNQVHPEIRAHVLDWFLL